MLVLSRNSGESVVIQTPHDGAIEVVLVATQTGRARLGFIAPPSCLVLRRELLDRPRPVGEDKS